VLGVSPTEFVDNGSAALHRKGMKFLSIITEKITNFDIHAICLL
jgi:hypothetical protein